VNKLVKLGHEALLLALVSLGGLWGCEKADPGPTLRTAHDCLTDPGCRQVMVVAHRGHNADHPENSLAGLRAAAEVGCDYSELDVRHTADGVLILMHDGTVDRTTDATGDVESYTLAQIQDLLLLGGEPGNPESTDVPLFTDALALSRELGIMVYVDQKTDRSDLVLADIESGNYYEVALVRDDLVDVATMASDNVELLVMPPLSDGDELEAALAAVDTLRIVEIARLVPDADLTALILTSGLQAQQDVMADGDGLAALGGDYTGWKAYVEAGVQLLQTNFPELLVPAVEQYNRTGVFPEEGPGAL
jgi:glycerophosphoryl diester phosphodiesterase